MSVNLLTKMKGEENEGNTGDILLYKMLMGLWRLGVEIVSSLNRPHVLVFRQRRAEKKPRIIQNGKHRLIQLQVTFSSR
ncbi:hypothetical protein TNCV_4766941 [Trichonephila clavipes]|nr:hypothetical protein TNCV_4766941 [Trichonephila clavipes]